MPRTTHTATARSGPPDLVKSQTDDADLVQRRRGQIVQAAVKLFSAQGFYKTTVQQIAAEAQISNGLIYHYARTKEDILLLALMSVLEGYKQELPRAIEQHEDAMDRLLAGVRAYCNVVDRSRDATVLAYRSTKSLPDGQREHIKQLEIETNRLIEDCIQACIDAGYFRQVNVSLSAYHFVSFAHAWALKHWRLATLTTKDAYIRDGFDFFVRALVTPKGWRRYQKSAQGLAGSP